MRTNLLFGAILALAASNAAAEAWIVGGVVVGVSDGDTITVLDNSNTKHKIRFAGIDAPEKGQAFGDRSKQNLAVLVFLKRVEARCHKKDRYGREICAVFVSLRDVSLEQIRHGMAWHYKEYHHEQTTRDRLVSGRSGEREGAAYRTMDGREAGAAVGVAKRRPRRKVDAAPHATLAGV